MDNDPNQKKNNPLLSLSSLSSLLRLFSINFRGFLRRIFDFFVQNLAAQALKTVTLGDPLPRSSMTHHDPGPNEWEQGNSDSDVSTCVDDNLDDGHLYANLSIEEKTKKQKGPPKKMVSINEATEVMYPSKAKKKKRKTEKSASMESGKEQLKPLKSILRVGSSLSEGKAD
ncbi:hypothetical protein NMG60_11032143 [Bertholletia excelsa]